MKITKDNFCFDYIPMVNGSSDDGVKCTVSIAGSDYVRIIPVSAFNLFRYVRCYVRPHEYHFTCGFVGTPPSYFFVFFSRFIRGMV